MGFGVIGLGLGLVRWPLLDGLLPEFAMAFVRWLLVGRASMRTRGAVTIWGVFVFFAIHSCVIHVPLARAATRLFVAICISATGYDLVLKTDYTGPCDKCVIKQTQFILL